MGIGAATAAARVGGRIVTLTVTLGAVVSACAAEPPRPAIAVRVFYVSPTGRDAASGRSPAQAWRTVGRVDRSALRPGDTVRFRGGATFVDHSLIPPSSGTAAGPITFAGYGRGMPYLSAGVYFPYRTHLVFSGLALDGPRQGFDGTGSDITVRDCRVSGRTVGIQGDGTGWTIVGSAVSHTGDSGLLLSGRAFAVTGNVISDTGLDRSIAYGKHGVYLKASGSLVTGNLISGFADDGVSVRRPDDVVTANRISRGDVGIAWFAADAVAGSVIWSRNLITDTTGAGLFVSGDARSNRPRFVITGNIIRPAHGPAMNLHPTAGGYALSGNRRDGS